MSNPIPPFEFETQCVIDSGRTKKNHINEIKAWLNENLQIPRQCDQQVVLFLLSCNNDIELTKKTILNYYKDKCNAPELFCNRDPADEGFLANFNVVYLTSLPKYTEDNCLIMFSGIHDTSYKNFNLDQLAKAFFMCLESALNRNPPSGLKIMLDFRGFGFMHLTRLKLGTVQKVLHYLQESLPCQLKEIHIVNTNYLFEKVLYLCKPFLKKELMEMIRPHSASLPITEFHKIIGAEYLPKEFGGDLPSIQDITKENIKNLKALKSYFTIEEKQMLSYKQY